MTSSPQPEGSRLPLTGADCFLRAFDAQVRRYSQASHLSQLVLRLDPGFKLSRLQEVVREVAGAHPILRAPIRRGLGAPHYRLDRPGPFSQVTEHAGGARRETLPPVFAELLNGVMEPRRGELLRFDAVSYDDGCVDLAMTWLHMLFDGSGSEYFATRLAEIEAGTRSIANLAPSEEIASASQTGLRGRGEQARAWQQQFRALAAHPPRSLAGPLRREPQSLEFDLTIFDPPESEQIGERARTLAGFLTPMLFYLAATIRAHDAVFLARGARPESYVVPLPVDLRAKGGEPAIFRTRVSMLWFQARADEVDNLETLLARLKQQRKELIRSGSVAAGLAAMDFARFAPKHLYAQMARRDFSGELCSFFFAFTDQFMPDCEYFFGARVRNGFHVPSVPPSPGSSAILSLRGDRLNLTHVRQRGVFRGGELDIFREQLKRDLLGTT
jgi:hypothetical protein